MKKVLNNFTAIILFTVAVSCSNLNNKDDLTRRVRNDINIEFAKRSTESNISYSIVSFGLVQKEGNEYSGILETIENGESFKYEVSVTVDGDSYLWKIIN